MAERQQPQQQEMQSQQEMQPQSAAASPKDASPRPADPTAIVRQLFPAANPKARGLMALLTCSLAFAKRDERAGETVIDIASLISAMVVVGSVAGQGTLNSSAWVWDAIAAQADRPDSYAKLAAALRSQASTSASAATATGGPDLRYVVSATARNRLLPRACELAQETMGRAMFDQRHLVAALLEQTPDKWSVVGIGLDPDGFDAVRLKLVEAIGRQPESGENMDAWRTLYLRQAAQQQQRDFLAAQRDHPSLTDDLGRAPFAQVLANRLVEVRPTQTFQRELKGIDRAFMINLDGPWGSGKSTIVNFIKADLSQRSPPWLTVDFNAWRGQRITPAWWGIVNQLAAQVPRQLSPWHGLKFRLLWLGWKLRNDFAPLALAGMLFGLAFLLWSGSSLLGLDEEGKLPLLGIGVSPTEILTFLTTFAGAASLGRHLFFGSSKAGDAMAALSEDPYIPVVRLFDKLITAARRPILVVVDDIDRCSGSYVVDLLEDIQTMLREAPISYLVVGDRSWITTSFKDRYVNFEKELDAPGRPIGHQFLDKVFQISVSVPTMSRKDAEGFWQNIVNHGGTPDDVAAKREQARSMLAGADTEQELQAIVGSTDDAVLRKAVAAEAAIRASSPEFAKGLESRYARYGLLLDANPRSIKRLVNKLAINQSVMLMEEREIVPGPLARWTILELRWPQVAECLCERPELLDEESLPFEHLQPLWKDRSFREVVGSDKDDRLCSDSLRGILGH